MNGFQDELVFLFSIEVAGLTFICMEVGMNLGHYTRYSDSNIMCCLSVIYHERSDSALKMSFHTFAELEYLIITDA